MAIKDLIEEAVATPKKVSGDAGTVERVSIDDLIKADKHLASKAATCGEGLKGVKFFKLRPPAAI